MATITFKAKIRNGFIDVPVFTRKHCDMNAFRSHPKFGALANSDLFPNCLARIRRNAIGSDYHNWIKAEAPPAGFTIDQTGFLATVTLTVP